MALKWLQTFVMAAKYANYSIAAEKLYLAQPTVSQHIKNLEKSLDTKLFEKSGRNIELTKAGKIFLPTAQKMIDEFNSGLEKVTNFEKGMEESYTLATSPYIACNLLPQFCHFLFENYPKIDLTIEVVKSTELDNKLLLNEADFTISRIEPQNINIDFLPVLKDKIVLAVPNEPHFIDSSLEEIVSNHRMLINDHPYYIDEIIPYLREKHPNLITLNLSQIEVIKSFLINGIGYAFLPYSSVKDEIDKGTLAVKELEDIPISAISTIYFCHKKQSPSVAKLQVIFREFMMEYHADH